MLRLLSKDNRRSGRIKGIVSDREFLNNNFVSNLEMCCVFPAVLCSVVLLFSNFLCMSLLLSKTY